VGMRANTSLAVGSDTATIQLPPVSWSVVTLRARSVSDALRWTETLSG